MLVFLKFSSRNIVLLNKVARFIVQGPVSTNKMGNPFSRNYSPNSQRNLSSQRMGRSSSIKFGGTRSETFSQMESSEGFVEAVVCNENDMKDNEMKVFDIEGGQVLVIRQNGEYSAIGSKCTHYGAPLVSGALGSCRVRCPWHGATFNTMTGDIEDFPGFDSLPCHQVTITDKNEVRVRARKSELESNRRSKETRVALTLDDSKVVIIGGGPSGATCAETLRGEGYKGRITIVSKENHLPYDRIKVSKIGTVTGIEKLQARSEEYYKTSRIDIMKGLEAIKVDTTAKLVYLNDGTNLNYSSLYIATGSKPRVPEIPGINLNNIFTVRNFEDSVNILTTLGSEKDKNVVVLGLSFIGLEIAASCYEKAKTMTVVGKDSQPLGAVFGAEIGNSLRKLFMSKGVKFHFNTTIVKCNGEDGDIRSVELDNGTTIGADVLILGVGTKYNTSFLKRSGVNMEPDGAVIVNDKMETNVKDVYAGGDIAKAPVAICDNNNINIGHIGLAQYHGKTAALNILNHHTPLYTVPYFWTMLFGKSIRYTGYGRPASTLIDGDIDELRFVIFFFDEDEKVIAIASCMRDPIVSQFAEFLYNGRTLYKKDLKDDLYGWTKYIHDAQLKE